MRRYVGLQDYPNHGSKMVLRLLLTPPEKSKQTLKINHSTDKMKGGEA